MARSEWLQGEPFLIFLGPLGFDYAQHRQTLRPTVDGIRSEALCPLGLQ